MGPCFRRDDVEFACLPNKSPERENFPPRRCICRKNLRGVVAGDGLDLEIFFQAVFAPFAAVAGLLVAAERRGAVVRHALQVDVAGADLAADLTSGLHAVGRDVTGQTVRRVVGDLDRVGFIPGAEDGEHGAEDFLARDGHVVGDVREDGRTHIEALVDAFRQARTAGHQRRTFLDALLDQRLDLVPLDARHDRTDGGAFGAGIAGLGFFGDALGDGGDFLHLRQRHDHPGWRVARLTGVDEHVRDTAGDRLVQIGAFKNDVRRLAAQFLTDALDGRRGALGDIDAGAGRAGERDHVDVWVLAHGGTDFRAEAVDEVEHTLRHAGLMQDFGENQRRRRREFGRLQEHGAAGGERGRNLAGDLVQRPVPRRDHADDADGLAHHHRRADRLFEVIVFQNLERGCEVAEAGAGLHLLRHRQRRAHLVGDGGANILHAGLVDLDDFREQRHALLAGRLRKRPEGALGRGHRLVDVGLGAERNLVHRLFGRRVDDGGGLLDDRIDPGAVDVELHAVDHRRPLDFGANGRETERSASILARNLRKMNPPYAGRRTAAAAPYKISAVKEARRSLVIYACAGPHPDPARKRERGQSAFAANTEQEPQRHNWYFTAHFL